LHAAIRGDAVNRRSDAESLTASVDQLGVARVGEIHWGHPRLAGLSDAAKLVYACLVDGLSTTARETIDSVDQVWQDRFANHARYTAVATAARREAFWEICLAVEELLGEGLLVLLDRTSIKGGWVMKPWEAAS